MEIYDDIVVGSGISGLTTALILGMNQRKVLLIEKAPKIGGSLSRFYKKGIPFDTGFHFSGGFSKDTVLLDMLSVLSIKDDIHPEFISKPENNRFLFENQKKSFMFSPGFDQNMKEMLSYFPNEEKAILAYFSKVKDVREKTTAMNIRSEVEMQKSLDEDFISLKNMLDSLTKDKTLKTLFGAFSMCHGTEPSQISFANHARVSYSIYESIARVKNGGHSFIKALIKKLKKYDVKIKTNTFISSCENIEKRRVGTFVLNNGESIKAENCIFTIHPEEILKTFKEENTSKAFADRVNSFEESFGLFLCFIKFSKKGHQPFDPAIITLYPDNDMNKFFDPEYKGDRPLVLVQNSEEVKKEKVSVINAFELTYWDEVKQWADSKTGKRSKDYEIYKQNKTNRICERIIKSFPEYKDCIEVIDSASMLTFRDYLNSPYGSAYGIKQKIGQFNLFGRIQYKNTFAAGQSAILPGVLGAMVSGFTICRYLLSKDVYAKFIKKELEE
ncbi:MAG: FAD-dependent oxidoreductase [Desulfobacteraceae bacterium]|nr:FAD-dependent oxidoreductase [Desulfobacteraceae bacterium]